MCFQTTSAVSVSSLLETKQDKKIDHSLWDGHSLDKDVEYEDLSVFVTNKMKMELQVWGSARVGRSGTGPDSIPAGASTSPAVGSITYCLGWTSEKGVGGSMNVNQFHACSLLTT